MHRYNKHTYNNNYNIVTNHEKQVLDMYNYCIYTYTCIYTYVNGFDKTQHNPARTDHEIHFIA